jgi:hypothetical protein
MKLRSVLSYLLIVLMSAGIYAFVYLPAKGIKVKANVEATTDIQDTFQSGDIIFQSSHTGQSLAVQLATHSPYSHCGMIWWEGGNCYVLEAVSPVKVTPLEEFITHGDGGHYVIKRVSGLREKISMVEFIQKLDETFAEKYKDKPYDIYFGWGNDKIYCSELVWKLYKETTGLEVGKLQKLKEFDLTNPIVKKKLKERYGNHIPYEESVISPASIFDSPLLETVAEN